MSWFDTRMILGRKPRITIQNDRLVRTETKDDPYTGLRLTRIRTLPRFELPPYRGRQA